jgi:ATP-dependent Clp endopeptidase proteolytic subunit ClpP
MIYCEEHEHKEEAPEEEGHPFGIPDEEDPLIGLVGEITESSTQQLALMLLGFQGGRIIREVEEDEERPDDIEFFISSAGGSVSEMFTVYDLMELVKNVRDIATFGYGKIGSAAVPLLAAGTPGKRYMAKHARLMIHHCSANMSGPQPDVRNSLEELKHVEEMMVTVLAAHSKLTTGEIYNIMSRNTDEYFSAEEALEMGIVDQII